MMGREFGGNFPPKGGNGGGGFWKTDIAHTLVMCQRTYILNLMLIKRYFKMEDMGEGISPPRGERGGISENGQNSHSSNAPEYIHT